MGLGDSLPEGVAVFAFRVHLASELLTTEELNARIHPISRFHRSLEPDLLFPHP